MSATDQAALEQWHVQVEAGDVRLWTLDQLDAAFKAELVDESTFVLEVGKTEWMQLGTLLGGDDEEPAAAQPPAPPARAALGLQIESYTPIAPVMFHDANPLVGDVPPYSTAPMAADIDDESPASFRGSRKRPMAIGFGVALVAAGIAAFAFTHGRLGAAEEQAPAAAAVAPPPAPPPAPVAPAPEAAPESQASIAARLSHDQLIKLADADRAREAKVASQQKARAAAAPHRSHSSHVKEKSPFQSGGDKYDPLNAKL
jgi:hypothetical protein